MATSWAAWLRDRLDEREWRQADLVKHGGDVVTRAKVSRWLAGDHIPDIDSVRAVCAALDVPAVEGLIAAGHLLPEDVGVRVITRPRATRELSDGELLDEIGRRLWEREETAGQVEQGPVMPRQTGPNGVEGEQWAARRRPT